jgi:hypothetical protein
MHETNTPGIEVDSLYRFHSNDVWIVLCSFVVVAFVRFLLQKFVFTKIAELYKINKTDHRFKKLLENGWYTVWYTFSFLFATIVLWKEDYIWDWNLIGIFPAKEDIGLYRYFYLINLGYCLQMLLYHIYFDTILDDFIVLLMHHIVTILLVSISYAGLHHRQGSVVFILHDFVDIFLYGAKFANYLGTEQIATVMFILFASSMCVCRLIAFPNWIYYVFATNVNSHIPLLFFDPSRRTSLTQVSICIMGVCTNSTKFLGSLLCCLVLMHIYWFYLVILMVYKILYKGAPRADIRELNRPEYKNIRRK